MKLRILITGTVGESLPPPYAGIPKLTLLVARKWKEMGHSVGVTFVSKKEKDDDLGAQGEYFFEYKGVPNKFKRIQFLLRFTIKNPLLYFSLLKEYVRTYKKISKEGVLYSAYGVFLDQIYSKFRPDIVLAEAALVKTFMASLIARKHKVPIVFDTYAEVHDNSMREISREHTLKFWKKFLDMAELIIAPSFFCGKGPGEYVATEKLIVLYPGIDTGLLKEVENEDVFVARKRFNLPEDFFLVGAVGAFVSRKGHDHLIKASANLIKNGNKIGIVLCGPGSKDWLVSLSKKEGIENNVYFFTGLSEKDLFLLYRSLDLYCDASNTPRACLGMSLTEAMLVGVPAIAYNNGGLPEIVKEGDNGLLVPLDDIDRLSQGIERMSLLPKEERQKMGERGKIMCKKIVDLDAMAVKKIGLLIKVKQNYK